MRDDHNNSPAHPADGNVCNPQLGHHPAHFSAICLCHSSSEVHLPSPVVNAGIAIAAQCPSQGTAMLSYAGCAWRVVKAARGSAA